MTPLVWCARLAVALGTAWLSLSGGFDPWLEGAAFGVAVVIWVIPDFRGLSGVRTLAFVASSGLIYEIVFRFAVWTVFHTRTWDKALFGPAGPGLLLGTVLLPVAQAVLLRTSWKRVAVAVPGIALVCVACLLVVPRFTRLSLGMLAVVWQVAYLLFFASYVSPVPRASEAPAAA